MGALTVAAVIAPLSAAGTAEARPAPGRDWTTIETFEGAKQQACKVAINDGTAWRIFNRLDARRLSDGRVAATLTATRSGEPVADRSWASDWVRHGNVSDVGSFKIPRGARWALTMSVYGDQSGTGGELSAASIDRC
ncbi:hypothetical protein [Nocardioides stalactiti]|uniref:hypothetical protein n=1 Tax=Nocardioides stalactiti TaxID=2755356 RepID=UPI001602D453|nr:hypothetical protein [Nocardioides stalactiti]